jgi:DNA-binding NtrC family response regulator
MPDITRILVVDDDDDVLAAARFLLKQSVGAIRTESKPESLLSLLQAESFDVILLDMNFSRDVASGQEGLYWLGRIIEFDPDAVVIMITAFGDVELAVKAIRRGATDFVVKPWQNEKLVATVSSALRLRQSRRQARTLLERQQQLADDLDQPFQDFIADSPAMQEVLGTIRRVAPTDANVLILGENGTGKEVVARAVHRQSARSDQVFVSVDMGAVSDSLFESELFGHVKGAFTDARTDRAGRFEIASGGTLFLDEIGNLPMRLQARILTVLEQRQVTRLGSNKPIPIDIRLICATNHPLPQLVSEQKFRPDLLYRINTVQIELPPLRRRPEDILPLTEHYLHVYCARYKKTPRRLPAATIRRLQEHSWPGNVRELQHAVERAVILTDRDTLEPSDFPFSQVSQDASESIVVHDYDLEHVEKTIIQRVLLKHDGNISRAAAELGLTRTALYRRMQKYGF